MLKCEKCGRSDTQLNVTEIFGVFLCEYDVSYATMIDWKNRG